MPLLDELKEKIVSIEENVPKVYDAGYQKGKADGGGDSEFVGIKFSNFTYRGNPKTADARSLPDGKSGGFGGYDYLFANTNKNGNGGFSLCWKRYIYRIYIDWVQVCLSTVQI